MRFIRRARRGGKTTELIGLSAKHGGYIICHDQREAGRIVQQAHDMGLTIPTPLTFSDLVDRRYYGAGTREFYIDNADDLLRYLCAFVPIGAVTWTGEGE